LTTYPPPFIFRLNFIPIALEKFPGTFDIFDEQKTFFPHGYNKMANITAGARQGLPPKEDYFYSSMKVEKRREFLQWYLQHREDSFNLPDQLFDYCMADVRLLSEGLLRYREIMKEECQLEVLDICTTLAGAMMTHYRMNILQKDTIGVASELSYERHDKQSAIARKYLKWFAETNNVHVQHVETEGGEKRLTPKILLDGFVAGGMDGHSRDLAIEING
jgi:hypothetical protein